MIQFIDDPGDEFGVEPVCGHLPIAPQTYYAARTREPSLRSITDEGPTKRIHEIHTSNCGVYGVRKVHAELCREGGQVARCTVEKLMKKEGLRGICRAKRPRTTILGSLADLPADLAERRFTATAPDCLWVADIPSIRKFSGWVYAAFVIDVFARLVVGWQLSTSLHTDLALEVLEVGIWTRRRAGWDLSELMHHSDRGVQGGFNWSSQPLEIMEVCDGSSSAGCGSGPQTEVEVALSPEFQRPNISTGSTIAGSTVRSATGYQSSLRTNS